MPELSVIVPIYKAEKYIRKCIDSILNQSFCDYELILVDDGSPDSCGAICDEYAAKDGRIKVIHKRNSGVSEARNVGLDIAGGSYISFIDPDDWVEPDLFYNTINFCKSKQTDIVCFEVCTVRSGRKHFRYRFDSDKVFAAGEALKKILVDVIDNSPCNKIYKKAVWKGVRFPVGRHFEDVATIYKTFYNADKIGYIKKYLYYYLKHEGSATALSFDAQRRYECFLGYWERYEFSRQHCKEAEEKCKTLAVDAAISTVTVLEAGSGCIGEREKDKLFGFLYNQQGDIKYLKAKNRLLLWGVHHCLLINKIYGKLSSWSKKLS
jgi:glycosyltransferase involved in cell wall biosynthesis